MAVLPFANMISAIETSISPMASPRRSSASVAAEGLRVAATNLVVRFQRQDEDLRVIADRLGVRTVLEGSVRKAVNRLRVTAQLINASDGCHLWSERLTAR